MGKILILVACLILILMLIFLYRIKKPVYYKITVDFNDDLGTERRVVFVGSFIKEEDFGILGVKQGPWKTLTEILYVGKYKILNIVIDKEK